MDPYPTNWRQTAASEGVASRGFRQPTPLVDQAIREFGKERGGDRPRVGRQSDLLADLDARRRRGEAAVRQARERSAAAGERQRSELERMRQERQFQRGRRSSSFVPQSMMPMHKTALAGMRLPMRHPAFQALKMSLDFLDWTSSRDLTAMLPQFLGYEITNVCYPEFAVPPYLGRELMADLTSGAACLVLQAIAENPLPALPASAPDVGFSTYRQGPFGRWATVVTYAPQVAGEAPALATGPMMASEGLNMFDALGAAGGRAQVRPLPLALNAARSAPNPMRSPQERDERGYGRDPNWRGETQFAPQRAWPYDRPSWTGWRKGAIGDRTGKALVIGKVAFPRVYKREQKVLRVPRAVVALIGQVTEGLDFIESLYQALPEKTRKKCAAPFAKHGKSMSTKGKINCLLANWDKVDAGVAMYNVTFDAVFDMLQALISKRGVKLSAAMGLRPQSLSQSRAAPGDMDGGTSGSISQAVKAWLKHENFRVPGTKDYLEALGVESARKTRVFASRD